MIIVCNYKQFKGMPIIGRKDRIMEMIIYDAKNTDSKIRHQERIVISMKELVKNNPHETATTMLKNEELKLEKLRMRYLGMLKAWLDSIPESEATRITKNDIPLNFYIKLAVDTKILDKIVEDREMADYSPFSFDLNKDYIENYNKLMIYISGYGYSLKFNEEHFERLFSAGTAVLAASFAEGYHDMIFKMAEEVAFHMVETKPKEEEVFKNWEYFLKRGSLNYTLEGTFIPMYSGGGQRNIHEGFWTKEYNVGLYAKLRMRKGIEKEVEKMLELLK